MSHSLTESSTFTPTVIVPDGADPGTNRAGDVATMAQALANRTRYLLDNGLFETTPVIDFAGNINFHGTTDFNDQLRVFIDDADRPALLTERAPSDSPVAGNKWKLVGRFKMGPTAHSQYADVYTGQDGALYGGFLIAVNAYWNSLDQLWHVRDTAKNFHGIIWTYDGLVVSGSAGAVGTFADWPGTNGVPLGGIASVGSLNAVLLSTANGLILENGVEGVDANGTTAQRTRHLVIDLANHVLVGGNTGSQLIFGPTGIVNAVSGPTNNTVWFPLRLPNGATLLSMDFIHQQPSGTTNYNRFTIGETILSSWVPSPAPPVQILLANGVTDTSATGVLMMTTVTPSANTVDNTVKSFWCSVQLLDPAAVLKMLRMTFVDPGPRNT